MILIVTHKQDYTADIVIAKLNDQQIPYFRLNTEDLLDLNSFYFRNSKNKEGLNICIDGLSDFSSVWFRRVKLPKLSNLQSVYERNFILIEIEMFFKNLWSILDSFWISDPFNVYKAENKLYQLKIARKIGFITPATLVTNSKKELESFFCEFRKDIIIKPIFSSQVSYEEKNEIIFTNKLRESHFERLDQYSVFPAIYQEYIPKNVELRVTVVGELVFTAAVNSQRENITQIDWRRGKERFYIYNLPNEIRLKCIELVQRLGLVFGAIDLILTPNDDYIFLEINPNGQWGWIEFQTKQNISGAIINQLKNGK